MRTEPTRAGRAGSRPQVITEPPQSRRPGRTARPDRNRRPADPRRPVSPVRSPGPGRPGRPVRIGPARPAQHFRQPGRVQQRGDTRGRPLALAPGPGVAQRAAESGGRLDAGHGRAASRLAGHGRATFVLLLIGLLAGGLVCLLVVNTTLATNALQIGGLAQANAASAQRLMQIRQEVATEQSPAVMEREAAALGMRPDLRLTFVDLGARRIAGAVAATQSPSPALATGRLPARSGGRRPVHRRRA